MSTGPASSARRRTSSALDTSAATKRAFPPASSIACTVSAPRWGLRPCTTTLAPSAASCCAIAMPMPTAPPDAGPPHLLPEQPDVNNLEGWSALAPSPEITSHADMGLLVTGIGYRNPDLLGDMARTVDHISGGRLVLGLGSGWYEKDYAVYGYHYGTVKSRLDLFDAGLSRIEHRLSELTPAPLHKIPILIGGGGERRTLPVVARHADIWHSFESLSEFRRKNELLKDLAADAERMETLIERAIGWTNRTGADPFHAEGGA